MICEKCGAEFPEGILFCGKCGEPLPQPETPVSSKKKIGPLVLGLVISALAIVGAVSIISSCVTAIKESLDTTYLHEEMYYYLEPLMYYAPDPFTDGAKNPQDAFLTASAYRVINAERIRMARDKDEFTQYPVDDYSRIGVPVSEIEEAYKALFGPDAVPDHAGLESKRLDTDTTEEDKYTRLEYDESENCYWIPYFFPSALERAIVLSVEEDSDQYVVRLGFVPTSDIEINKYGQEVEPTESMATHFMTYTLRRMENGSYYIHACKDE